MMVDVEGEFIEILLAFSAVYPHGQVGCLDSNINVCIVLVWPRSDLLFWVISRPKK